MAIELVPEADGDVERAVAAALERADIDLAAAGPTAAGSLWRQAALAEGLERMPGAPARSPRAETAGRVTEPDPQFG